MPTTEKLGHTFLWRIRKRDLMSSLPLRVVHVLAAASPLRPPLVLNPRDLGLLKEESQGSLNAAYQTGSPHSVDTSRAQTQPHCHLACSQEPLQLRYHHGASLHVFWLRIDGPEARMASNYVTHKAYIMDYMLEGLTAGLAMAYPVYRVVYVCDLGVIPESAVNGTETRAWARDRQGVYLAEFEASEVEVRFKPPLREYDPTEHTSEILRDATALDLGNEFAILEFLSQSGLLGVAEPKNEVQIWDPAWQTKDQLREVQRLGAWLSALKEQRWGDSAIPLNKLESNCPGAGRPCQGKIAPFWPGMPLRKRLKTEASSTCQCAWRSCRRGCRVSQV